MTVTVSIALATICFASPPGPVECHPALIGDDTPRGEFRLNQRLTRAPGYGGDVLQFLDAPDGVFAVHRVYLLNPRERRAERLRSPDPAARRVTRGCVNVAPEVYDRLVRCCSNDGVLVIE